MRNGLSGVDIVNNHYVIFANSTHLIHYDYSVDYIFGAVSLTVPYLSNRVYVLDNTIIVSKDFFIVLSHMMRYFIMGTQLITSVLLVLLVLVHKFWIQLIINALKIR